MREIRTSGLMSGDGKRGVAAWPKPPRPSSTLPGSDECGLITGVGSRVFHYGIMARRAGERGERMFGVMGEVSVGRG
jgi:hypothetical protein